MKSEALRRLMALTEARKARDLAALKTILAEVRRIEAEIAEIGGTLGRDMAEDVVVPMINYGRRLAWAEHETARRRAKIAALAPHLAAARAVARTSLGKHQAMEKLVEVAVADERLVRERRAEAQTMPVPQAAGRPGAAFGDDQTS